MNHSQETILETLATAFPSGYCDIAYRVPIEHLEYFKDIMNALKIKVRYRFRGTRQHSVGRLMPRNDGTFYKRTRYQAYQDCLAEDATHFSVYLRK